MRQMRKPQIKGAHNSSRTFRLSTSGHLNTIDSIKRQPSCLGAFNREDHGLEELEWGWRVVFGRRNGVVRVYYKAQL